MMWAWLIFDRGGKGVASKSADLFRPIGRHALNHAGRSDDFFCWINILSTREGEELRVRFTICFLSLQESGPP